MVQRSLTNHVLPMENACCSSCLSTGVTSLRESEGQCILDICRLTLITADYLPLVFSELKCLLIVESNHFSLLPKLPSFLQELLDSVPGDTSCHPTPFQSFSRSKQRTLKCALEPATPLLYSLHWFLISTRGKSDSFRDLML